MFGLFGKRDNKPMSNDDFGSIGENLADRVLNAFGISREQLDKVKAIIDMVEVKEYDSHVEIVVNLKTVTIKIDK
jgi:hypothetical protein